MSDELADFSRGVFMYGEDPDGNAVKVLCDADGRIKGLTIDGLDIWSQRVEIGNAELAARLRGPIVAWDRRGQFVYQEDFADGLGLFKPGGVGSPSVARITTEYVQAGGCAQMTCDAGAGNRVEAAIYLPPLPATTALGVALWMRFANLPNEWFVRVRHYDGTNYHDGRIRGLLSDGKLYYLNSGASYTEFGTWDSGAFGSLHWNVLKFTLDLEAETYGYCILNGDEVDLSANAYRKAATTNLFTELSVYMYAQAATAVDTLVDCFAATVQDS